MKIAVVAGFSAGSSYAHAINTVKMAEGFARLGHRVLLITKGKEDKPYRDLKALYGLKTDIEWDYVSEKIMGVYPVGVHEVFLNLCKKKLQQFNPDFVYSRNYCVPAWTAKKGYKTVAETHAFVGHRTRPFMKMINAAKKNKSFHGITTIAEVLKDYYRSLGVNEAKIKVLPDVVDFDLFAVPKKKGQSPYEIYGDGPHIVYSGHLYDYKGIPTILSLAEKKKNMLFHLVGGTDQDISRHKKYCEDNKIGNVIFHGLKPFSDVPPYLWHADILLLPPSASHPSASWTSPVKLAEYCASGRPIIATDIPALRNWLDDDKAFFVWPDDAGAMASAIEEIGMKENKSRIKNMTDNAFNYAKGLTYENRAKQILDWAFGS